MGKIQVLSFEIANLIAAGEVVERPSSVLKELIENSIDAGATSVTAEIKHGGVSLIRVTDNGCGIEKEDLPVALKRHATSKIKSKEDLSGIMTLGFRGEALAAISSVSKVTIITRTANNENGYMLSSEAGKVTDINEVSTAVGTTVCVEDLFYNVPARRKFLKKDVTEAMNVCALVEKVALSRPDISIRLAVDGEEKFRTPGDGNLLNTVYAVLGREFAAKVVPVDAEAGTIRVHGYIGRSDNVRKNRNLENFFVNGRFVKSLTVGAAVEKAFTSYIAPEMFPACVLFVDLSASNVDVNVHPSKLEVKFTDERAVFEAVYYSVRQAITTAEYRPELDFGKGNDTKSNVLNAFLPIGADAKGKQMKMSDEAISNAILRGASAKDIFASKFGDKSTEYKPSYPTGYTPTVKREGAGNYSPPKVATMTPKESLDVLKTYQNAKPETLEEKGTPVIHQAVFTPTEKVAEQKIEEEIPAYRYVGEAFDTYVIVEVGDELLVMDKHAAHERVIFEDLKKSRQNDGRVASQSLLIPIEVKLTAVEYSAVNDFQADFEKIGFEIELSDTEVKILSIPDAVSAHDAEGLFLEMADEIANGRGNPAITEEMRRERALYQVACKAAIKGGRIYDRAVIDWLIKKVLSIPDITVCPHGRPIAYKLKKRELDKQFDRIK